MVGTRGLPSWLLPVLTLLLAVAPAFFWGGGVIEEAAVGFLRNYWGAQPIHRIFDIQSNDYYQGRELSYAIDCLDAQWVRLLLSRAVFVVVSPSVMLASLAFVAIGLWLVPAAFPTLDRRLGWLPLLLYLSNFAVASTAGLLYRATKPLVAPLLLALLLVAIAEHRRPRLGRTRGFLLALIAGLVMSLLDRQGLFYLLCLLAVLAAIWLRTRRGQALILGLCAAAVAWALYDHAIGPWLIHRVNGYWPDMTFQRFQPQWLLAAQPWIEGARLLGDWTRVLLGGVPPAALLVVAAALSLLWIWRERPRPLRLAGLAACFAAGLVAQLAMTAVMAVRHGPVMWIDHRFWYYPLPYQALLVFGLLWAFDRWRSADARVVRGAAVLLATLVVANLAQWPERRLIMESGPWFSSVERRSRLLLHSLRTGRTELLLDDEYRRFYHECLDRFPRLRERVGDYVAEGEGIAIAETHAGRVMTFARRRAHLIVTARSAAIHVLAGGAVLRPDETLTLLLGDEPVAEARGSDAVEGVVHFRIRVALQPGRSDLSLLLRTRKRPDGSRVRPHGFTLLLPVLVWRDTNEGNRSLSSTG